MGSARAAGWPHDRPGRVNRFCGLVANFYSLKTKKIPARRLPLGDWLGCYSLSTRVGIFAEHWSRSPLMMIRVALAMVTKGLSWFRGWLGSGFHFRDLGTRPHTCGLGAGLKMNTFLFLSLLVWLCLLHWNDWRISVSLCWYMAQSEIKPRFPTLIPLQTVLGFDLIYCYL